MSYAAAQEELCIGILIHSKANDYNRNGVPTNYDHDIFLEDYEDLIDTLADLGFNTIILSMQYGIYHYTFDERLNNYNYSPSRGFTAAEVKEMVRIARQRAMKVMPSLQVLSHQDSSVLSWMYPEYMLPEPPWQNGRYYDKGNYTEIDAVPYRCKQSHTASFDNMPGSGTHWKDCWYVSYRRTRDPFDIEGEQMIFGMIDELIDVFTVGGVKPEGIHIASDELRNWLDCPGECNGMTGAEIFAMAITNVYNYIKQNYPEMEVIMWGDMLDPYWNGGKPQTPVAGAVDLIPKDIIIDDWRYSIHGDYRYDSVDRTFPSVGEFLDKGFRVLVSPWREPDSSEELIWTANKENLRTGRVKGVIYTEWISYTVPGLRWALLNEPPNWRELVPPSDEEILEGIAGSIKQTIDLIGIEQCRLDAYCGIYPDCQNCNYKDGFYQGEYRDYYCDDGICKFKVIDFPADYVSFWDFNGDADDKAGRNNGTLINGASIVDDATRGQVLYLDGNNDYVSVSDSDSLDMSEELSLSSWFYIPEELPSRQTILGKHYTEYELLVYPSGRIHTYSSNGTLGEYDEGISAYVKGGKWLPNKWYHVIWTLKGTHETIYINGERIGDDNRKTYAGTLPGERELNIGKRTNGSLYFKGLIDDVMLYSRELSPVEVRRIYCEQGGDEFFCKAHD